MFGRPTNSGGRSVCRFFLEGRCKFGDNCKNEHPRNQAPQQENRFAPLQNAGNTGFRGRSGAVGGDQTSSPFAVFEDHIRDDLTTGKERPIWPMSAYGPGVKAPRQLLEGAVEVSPEEMRVQFYLAQAAGKPQEYAQQEESMLQQINQQIQAILSDLPGAKKYVIDGQDQHPNRNDMVLNPTHSFPKQSSFTQQTPSFGTGGSGFGAPSTLGGNKSAFGTSSAMGQGSAFGAPSSLNQPAGFGKPSPLGGGSTTAFGKSSPFGQPSSLGQKPSPFGSAPQQQQQQSSAFGQATQPSPFGQPSALGQSSGFGSQPQQPQQNTVFGQASGFGAPINRASPFAQAAPSSSSPFAQASSNQTTNISPFGQTTVNQTTNANPFARATQPASQSSTGFGQASQLQAPSNPFASATNTQQNTGFGASSQATNPFAASNAAKPGFGSATAPFGQQAGSVGNAGSSSGRSWHNHRVITDEKGISYYEVHAPTQDNPSNRRQERIWHPEGAPQAANLEIEGPAEAYTGELGKLLEGIYTTVRQTGTFGPDSGGVMPEVPPKREWISWEL